MTRITLDPGHGGHDPGAIGPTGIQEKDLTLYVALRTKESLEADPAIDVHLTRHNDRYVLLSDRARSANANQSDLFLSIHFNSATNHRARGHEVFTSPGETGADPFASNLFAAWCEEFPDQPARKDLRDGDHDKEAKFTVLTATHMPAALYECGFLSNRESESRFKDPAYLDCMATAFARGILHHLEKPLAAPPPDPRLPESLSGHVAQLQELLVAMDEQLATLARRVS